MNLYIDAETMKDEDEKQKHVLALTVIENAVFDFVQELSVVHDAVTKIMELLVADEISISAMQYEVTNILLYLHFEEKLGSELKELATADITPVHESIFILLHSLGKHTDIVRAGFEKAGFSMDTLHRVYAVMQERYRNGET